MAGSGTEKWSPARFQGSDPGQPRSNGDGGEGEIDTFRGARFGDSFPEFAPADTAHIVFVGPFAIRLGIDEQAFVGCSIYIFAQVLQRYFALNSQLNCFSQLTLLSHRSGEEILRCPERSADATPA